MNHYRQSIALFGIVVPIVVLVIVLGLGFFIKGKISSSFSNKQTLFKTYEANCKAATQIEDSIVKQRSHLDRWNKLLGEESLSAVNSNLSAIAKMLPSKEFQKGGFERSGTSSGFSTATAQRTSEIRISFRGTFRTMQRAFLELESRMPQLQLQELRITPNANQQNASPLLNFQVTYLAWEN
ncbi:MAG: hypothetical protein J0M04_21970 [Verrucomicrobia bacterium]|nr:hypothetical protein [Verrucomicrobiota bacterium]